MPTLTPGKPEPEPDIAIRDGSISEIEDPEPGGKWLRFPIFASPTAAKLMMVGYSFADQALAVGGSFLANVVLARTQTKEEYGMFALSYSVFVFLSGLHNAAILQPYTVYASGRYRESFSEYLRLITWSNAAISALLTALLLLGCVVLRWIAPQWVSPALLGLGLSVGILLSGIFLRRVFYVQRQPSLAASSSLVFFIVLVSGLWLATKTHRLDSFTVFLIMAAGWVAAGLVFARQLHFGRPKRSFREIVPGYWSEHWNYTKWLFATAFVFQLTTQGYYWVVGFFLSAREVGELRAIYILIGPIDQVFIAISYLVVPALAAYYASNKMSGFFSLWKRFLLATIGLTSLFAFGTRLFGKSAVHLLYAGKYDGVSSYLFVLGFLPLVMWIGTTMAQAFFGAEKPKFVFWAYIGSGATTLLVGTPLVMHYGLKGAVYGMLVSSIAYTVVLAITFGYVFQPLKARQ